MGTLRKMNNTYTIRIVHIMLQYIYILKIILISFHANYFTFMCSCLLCSVIVDF